MLERSGNPMDRFGAILSGIVISAIGAMVYNLLPLFLGTAQDDRELSDQAVGILSSMFYVGFTLTTSTAFFWIRTLSWRKVTVVAVPVAAVSLIGAGLATGFTGMAGAIFLSGCAFSALYGIGTTLLGDSSRPARWYGLKIASEAGLGAILLLILPGAVIARWGFEGMMFAMAAVVVVCAVFLLKLPAAGAKGEENGPGREREALAAILRLALWLALASVMVFLFSTTMIWAFVERMANDAGFEAIAVGNILSLTLVFAVGGSLLAMLLGERFGSGGPFAAACLLLLISLVLLNRVVSLGDYATAACLFTFSFGLGIPYVVTIVAELDLDGRFVVLTVPAIGIGVMAAPAVGGGLTQSSGYQAILWAGGIAVVLAAALSLLALKLGLPQVRAAKAVDEPEAPDPLL